MKKLAIKNLKTYPEDNADAASKKYVDDENAKYLKLDVTNAMSGALNLNNNSIVGVHDINATNSVVSKKYTDDKLAKKISFETGNDVLEKYTFIQGLSMGGSKITSLDSPTRSSDASDKSYVDTTINREVAKKLSLTGGTLSGNLQMSSQKITNLGDPTNPKDVANKRYVDSKANYTYHFSYHNLSSTFAFPYANPGFPTYWMYCAGLKASYFHLHSLCYDTDSSRVSTAVLTFKLDFFLNERNAYRYRILSSDCIDSDNFWRTIVVFL